MAKKNTAPVLVRCIDCLHEQPVVGEFPAWDGTPVFCTCQYAKYYKQRRWAQPCANYEPKGTESVTDVSPFNGA